MRRAPVVGGLAAVLNEAVDIAARHAGCVQPCTDFVAATKIQILVRNLERQLRDGALDALVGDPP